MRKIICALFGLLLCASFAFAFNSGIIGTVSGGSNYDPATVIQIARIQADGGTVVDAVWMDTFIKAAKAQSLYGTGAGYIQFAADPNWGVKKDSLGAVSKCYDISGNSNDAVQTLGAEQPTWTASSIGTKPGLVLTASFNQGFTVGPLSAITTGACFAVVEALTPWPGWGTIIINAAENVGLAEFNSGKIDINSAAGASTTTGLSFGVPVLIDVSGGYIYFNGVQDALGLYTPASMAVAYIGTCPGSYGWNGVLGTIIVGTSAFTTGQQTALRGAINTYYGIY